MTWYAQIVAESSGNLTSSLCGKGKSQEPSEDF